MRRSLTISNVANVMVLGLLGISAGCIPYTVGSTAQPVRPSEAERSMSWYFIPNGIQMFDTVAATFTGIDLEWRRGLDDGASDVGLRIPSLSGIVGTYKRRFGAVGDFERPAVAMMVGLGVVNMGQHGHLEFSLLASASQRSSVVPYGGLRVMQVVPLSEGAVSDSPTAGGFVGFRIGRRDFGVSPEIAVYYDRSALGIRDQDVIIVPAITVHGDELIRMLGRLIAGR